MSVEIVRRHYPILRDRLSDSEAEASVFADSVRAKKAGYELKRTSLPVQHERWLTLVELIVIDRQIVEDEYDKLDGRVQSKIDELPF